MFWQTAELQKRFRETVFIWVVCALASLAWMLSKGDHNDVTAFSHSAWVMANHDLLRWVSAWSMYPFYVFFVGMLLLGWYRQYPPWRLIGWGYLIAQLTGPVFIVRTLKILLGHARPESGTELWVGPSFDAAYNGFPSGHTCDLFVSGIFLAMCLPQRWMRITAMLFAAFNGVLRVALNKHYPLDVLFGVVIAGLVSFAVWRFWITPRLERA